MAPQGGDRYRGLDQLKTGLCGIQLLVDSLKRLVDVEPPCIKIDI
jgi:hypothetical protein